MWPIAFAVYLVGGTPYGLDFSVCSRGEGFLFICEFLLGL